VELLDIIETINKWPPEQFFDCKSAAEMRMKAFDAAFQKMLKYQETLLYIRRGVRKRSGMDKRNCTVRVDRFAEKMTDNGCPRSLAVCIGKQLEPKNPTETMQFYESAPFKMNFEQSQHFSRCCTFNGGAAGDLTHWHTELKRYFDDYGRDIAKRTAKGEVKLKTESRSHACRALDEHTSIRVNPIEEKEKFFEISLGVSPMLFVAANWAYSVDSECIPLAGLAAFLTCTRGYAWVLLLTVEELQREGKDLATITQWFDDQEPEALAKMPHVGLSEGDSLWYPFGYVPIVIGLENDKKSGDYVAYTVHHVLDEDMQLTPMELQGEIASHMLKNIAKKVPCLTAENVKRLKGFMKKFPVNG
jgi:hypothetical protein